MGLFGSVDTVHKLCRHKVTQVLHRIRCSVDVVVATFSMVTETVSVFHAQIQTLNTQGKWQKHNSLEVFNLATYQWY